MNRYVMVLTAGVFALAGTAVFAVSPAGQPGWGTDSASGGAFLVAVARPTRADELPAGRTETAKVATSIEVAAARSEANGAATRVATATPEPTKFARVETSVASPTQIVATKSPVVAILAPEKPAGSAPVSATELAPAKPAPVETRGPNAMPKTTVPLKPTVSDAGAASNSQVNLIDGVAR